MKRVGNFIILIGLTVGYCGPLYAQKPAERTFPSISEQQLPRFDASILVKADAIISGPVQGALGWPKSIPISTFAKR